MIRERLHVEHNLEAFSSGKEQLDSWLRNHARNADRAGTGRTYVWTKDGHKVVAYFTLAPHLIDREETPPAIGRGSPDLIPAILLARLALDRSLHGQGYGSLLLDEAMRTALSAVTKVGGRLLIVDALDDEAAAFYLHHGFKQVPDNPHRLLMKARDAARSLSISWP